MCELVNLFLVPSFKLFSFCFFVLSSVNVLVSVILYYIVL